MKKFLIILLVIIASIPSLFIGSAMMIGFYEGVTGKTVIPEYNETTSINSKVDKIISSSNEHKCDFKLKETKKATCQKTGEKVYKCSICNKEKKNKIEKISCNFKLKENKAPNFDDIGHRIYECSMCQKTKTEDYGKIISPIKFGVLEYEQDYVGGNSIRVQVQNTSDKEIKYVRYTLAFFNNVGDPIYDDIRGWYEMQWEIVGPIKPNAYKEFFGGIFYNHQFQGKYLITNLQIVYMDNTSINISNKEFSKYTNLLSNYNETKVIVCDNGASYHAEDCSTIEYNKNRGLKTISVSEAKEQGYDRCNICNP